MDDYVNINAIAIGATIASALAAGTVSSVTVLIAAGFIPALIVGAFTVVATTTIVYLLAKPVYTVVKQNAAGII